MSQAPAAEGAALQEGRREGEQRLRLRLAELCITAAVRPRDATHATGCVVKSLVFSIRGGGVALVVLPLQDKVDLTRLASFLGVKRNDVRLADPAVALQATGFPVGSIPPVGHLHGPLLTLLETSLLPEAGTHYADTLLLGGGGSPDVTLEVTVAELLRASSPELVSVVKAPVAAPAAPHVATAAVTSPPKIERTGTATPVVPTQELPPAAAALDERLHASKPLSAAVAGVLLQVASGDVFTSPDDAVRTVSTAPLFTVEATVSRVRRMGRLLVFATLHRPVVVPPVAEPVPPALVCLMGDDPQAVAPPMLQAILGRTFAAGVGDPGGAARMLRQLRPGRRLRFVGRVQSNPRGDGSVDLVTAAVTFLDDDGDVDAEDETESRGSVLLTDDSVDQDALDPDGEEPAFSVAMPNLAGPPTNAPSRGAPRGRASSRPLFREAGGAAPLFTLPGDMDVLFVDTAAAMDALAADVCDPQSAVHHRSDTSSGVSLPPVVALDAEWRPYASGGQATPVALLQVGTRRRVYLIDTLALAASGSLGALDAFLRQLLCAPEVIKLGFGLKHDLGRLAASYPQQLPCLRLQRGGGQPVARPCAVLELRDAAIAAASDVLPSSPQGGRRLAYCGLKTLCRLVLDQQLDKAAQMSDWAARPLSRQQTAYAAADVAVCCAIFDSLMTRSPKLVSQWRRLLDSPLSLSPGAAEPVGHGVTSLDGSEAGESDGSDSGGGTRHRFSSRYGRGDKVPVHELCVDVDGLLQRYLAVPLPSKGRDSALLPLAEAGQPTARPRGAGGARGGAVFTQNSVLLFMNAEPVAGKRYPNTLWRRSYDSALMMSWFGSPEQGETHPQVKRLVSGDHPVLLFARLPRGHYILLGRLACDGLGHDDADTQQPPPIGFRLARSGSSLLLLRMRLVDAHLLVGSLDVANLLRHAQGVEGVALVMRPPKSPAA
jgi:prolyl-tRNA editing enzyme YbaK/EbsC (Cys-tRNA(Pro) deacylase)